MPHITTIYEIDNKYFSIRVIHEATVETGIVKVIETNKIALNGIEQNVHRFRTAEQGIFKALQIMETWVNSLAQVIEDNNL